MTEWVWYNPSDNSIGIISIFQHQAHLIETFQVVTYFCRVRNVKYAGPIYLGEL